MKHNKKRINSLSRKSVKAVKAHINKLHLKQHTPKKYIKNYWKNLVRPIKRPYHQYKKWEARARKIAGIFKRVSQFRSKQLRENQEYLVRLSRYSKQVSKYNKWRDKFKSNLDKTFKGKKLSGKEKKKWVKLAKEYQKTKVEPPKGTPLDIRNEWKLEKQRELFLKWSKEQLNYIPRMEENGYLAILISPEAIEKYYKDEAKKLFSSLEEYRDFLKDYFGFGGEMAFGVTSTVFDSTGNVTGIIRFFRVLLKLVAKVIAI